MSIVYSPMIQAFNMDHLPQYCPMLDDCGLSQEEINWVNIQLSETGYLQVDLVEDPYFMGL